MSFNFPYSFYELSSNLLTFFIQAAKVHRSKIVFGGSALSSIFDIVDAKVEDIA